MVSRKWVASLPTGGVEAKMITGMEWDEKRNETKVQWSESVTETREEKKQIVTDGKETSNHRKKQPEEYHLDLPRKFTVKSNELPNCSPLGFLLLRLLHFKPLRTTLD